MARPKNTPSSWAGWIQKVLKPADYQDLVQQAYIEAFVHKSKNHCITASKSPKTRVETQETP